MTDTLRVTVELNGAVAIDQSASVEGSAPPPASTGILSPDSQWRRPLGTVSGTDVFYDGQTADICRWVGDRLKYERTVQGNGPWVATSNSTGHLWVANANTPRRKINVRTDIASSWRKPLQAVMDSVPIEDEWYTTYHPEVPSGHDSVMCVFDPLEDTYYELFWLRRKNGPGASGTLPNGDPDWLEAPYFNGADPLAYGSIHWGGAMKNVAESFGTFGMASWPPHSRPNWGAAAGGHIFLAGFITQEELAAGKINHAIAVNFGKMRSGVVAHPALRTDGLNLDSYSVPYGAHFRLPPELKKTDYTFATPFAEMVFDALQQFGMIAVNQTGSAFTLMCEDPRPSGNPNAFWNDDGTPNPNGWFRGMNPPAALDGIPWDSFLLLEQYKLKTMQTYQVEGFPTVWQQARILDFTAGRIPAAARYVGLLSAPPNRTGGGGTELPGARGLVQPTDWASPVDSGTNVSIYNANPIVVPAMTSARPAPVGVGLFDAATGGRMLHWGWLPPRERNPIPPNQSVTLAPQLIWLQDVGISFYPETNT